MIYLLIIILFLLLFYKGNYSQDIMKWIIGIFNIGN